MRRYFIITLLVAFSLVAKAQTDSVVCTRVQHHDVLTVRYGGQWVQDTYMTPLLYSGQMIGLANEWWQSFRCNTDWGHMGRLELRGARDIAESKSNLIYNGGFSFGWGAHYHFARLMKVDGLDLYIGPYAGGEADIKYIVSNVNKPVSLDAWLGVQAQGGLSYAFRAKRTSYRVYYTVATELLGAMVVPEYGESYYEVSEQLPTAICLSSLHNRQTIVQEIGMEFQFPHSAWRIGVEHRYKQFFANSLAFSQEQVCLVVGAVFDYNLQIRSFR